MTFQASIIDSHAHCGIQDRSFDQSFEAYFGYVKQTDIQGVVMFPPVMEIYDRNDFGFRDTDAWQDKRQQANEYLLDLGDETFFVIPYFFIWNDFRVDKLTARHKGIKWHRHADEPVYNYQSRECRKALEDIRRRRMPIVYEEELENTCRFITELARGIRVIIPHLGGLNGGYRALADHGLWENPLVYTDTSLAGARDISDYIETYGVERIMFGSDFPFGDPATELLKIRLLKLPPEAEAAVLGGNIKRLLSDSNV